MAQPYASRRVTRTDVARHAGVSTAVVSYVWRITNHACLKRIRQAGRWAPDVADLTDDRLGALLENLAAAKMDEQAKALAAEQGLAWVKPTLDPYASHDLVDGLVRLPAEAAPLTEAELARLDELDVSYD